MPKKRKRTNKQYNHKDKNYRIVVDKEKQEEQEKILKEIYSMKLDELDTGDIHKFYVRKKKWFWVILRYFVFFVLVFTISFLVYFYYNSQITFTGKNISIDLKTEDNIYLYKNVHFSVVVNNLENTDLKDVKLIVDFPGKFIISKSNLQHNANVWYLDHIKANTVTNVDIYGYFIEDLQDKNEYKNIVAKLYYKAKNFNSLFTTSNKKEILLSKTNLDFDIDQKQNQLLVTIYNKEDFDVDNFYYKMNIPKALEIENSDLEVNKKISYDDFDEYFWLIKTIKANGQVSFKIQLKNNDENENDKVKLYSELFLGNIDNKVILSSKDYQYQLLNTKLFAGIKINNNDNNKQSLALSNKVTYTITFTNNSDNTLKDVELTLFVDDFVSKDPLQHILNWNTVKDPYDGDIHRTDNGAKIIWTSKHISELKEFKAGDSISFDISINRYNSKLKNIKDWEKFLIKNYLRVSYLGEDAKKEELLSNDNYINFDKVLTWKLDKVEALGSSYEDNKIYLLKFKIDIPQDFKENLYNIKYIFTLNDSVEFLDFNELKEKYNIDSFSKYDLFQNENGEIVVKFDKVNTEVLNFVIPIKSSKDFKTDKFLKDAFKNIHLEYWVSDNLYTETL